MPDPAAIRALEKLCAERPEKTSELFTPNDYYGHASVIKEYCGLPQSFWLPGIHPHGPSVTDAVWDLEANHPFKNLLLVSELQRPAYAKACSKEAITIGSPLYYAILNLEHEVNLLDSQATGTVVFPFHSTHHVTVQFDEDHFLNYIKKLPDSFKPIVICLYWKDVQLGRHRRYIDAGFDCVSAGHIYDHEFLYRFIRIVASRRQCITNELGTCVFYSAALGLPVTIFKQEYELHGEDEKLLADNLTRPNLPVSLRLLEITRAPTAADVAEQMQLAASALGHAQIYGRSELKELLTDLRKRQPKPVREKRPWTERVFREIDRAKRRIGFS